MKKNVFYLIIFTLLISSCSTYNSFNHRKYFDFKHTSDEVAQQPKQNNKLLQTSPMLTVADINREESIVKSLTIEKENAEKQIVKKNKVIVNKNTTPAKGGLIAVKNDATNIILSKINKNKIAIDDEPKVKGKLWFVFAITFVIGFVVALYVSALFGTLVWLASLALLAVFLIIYLTSKHKVKKWRKLNGGEPQPEKKEKPKKEPKAPKETTPAEPKKPRG